MCRQSRLTLLNAVVMPRGYLVRRIRGSRWKYSRDDVFGDQHRTVGLTMGASRACRGICLCECEAHPVFAIPQVRRYIRQRLPCRHITAWAMCRTEGRFAGRLHRSMRSEEHTSELQSRGHLVCRLLREKKKPIVCR